MCGEAKIVEFFYSQIKTKNDLIAVFIQSNGKREN